MTKRSERQQAEECLVVTNSDRRNGWVISNRFVKRHFWKKNLWKYRRRKKIEKTWNAFWSLNGFYFKQIHITYTCTMKVLCPLLPEFSKAWQNICRERISFQGNQLQVTKLRSKCPQPWTVFKECLEERNSPGGSIII